MNPERIKTISPLKRVHLFFCLLSILLFSCTVTHPPAGRPGERTWIYAESLHARVERDVLNGNFSSALDGAREIIHSYPGFYRIDETHFLAAEAACSLGNYTDAGKQAALIPEKYPESSKREEALLLMSHCFIGIQNYYLGADALLQVLSGPVNPEMRSAVEKALSRLVRENLHPRELEELAIKYPSSPLGEELFLSIAKKEFARGNYEKAYEFLTELLYYFPESRYVIEARRLLMLVTEARRETDRRREFVDPFKIGVVLPITGPYSLFGRYFDQGLSTALEEYNKSHEFPVTVVRADSKGNPIDAARAVRKLVVEEGVVVLLGSVFTVPTMTASIEANAWNVSLLSPVVSGRRITEIGPWIFHTKVPEEVEVTAIASAANKLLFERFAVLSPADGDRSMLGGFFKAEIERLGGEIVAEAQYAEGETDFKDQMEIIREAAPEALFIPGSTEELILILPQLNFYDLQVQLLGLSNWNSEKLIRLSEKEMENALFPLAVYHGRDREAYEQLAAEYEEQFGTELNSVTVAGYFGIKLILKGLAEGAANREQVRDFLHAELFRSAEFRMSEAAALSIMTIRSGKVQEYTPLSIRKP